MPHDGGVIEKAEVNAPQAAVARALNTQAIAVLLKPTALTVAVLGLWGFASEFNWAAAFAIPSGPLSDWQIWLAAAGILQWCSWALGHSR